MTGKIFHINYGDQTSRFHYIADELVDKYCSLPFEYKPGLYSLYWESKLRTSGLLNELYATAVKILREVKTGKGADEMTLIGKQFHGVILAALLKYLEAIYKSDYTDEGQPEWMIQIARRLQKEAHTSFHT